MSLNNSQPAHSPESEMAFLASLIVNPSWVPEARKIVPLENLWLESSRAVYETILSTPALDLVTLKDALVLSGKLDLSGGIEKLFDMVAGLPTASHCLDYGRTINEFAKRREIVRLSLGIAKKTELGAELNGEIDELLQISKQFNTGSLPESENAQTLLSLDIPPLKYFLEPLSSEGNLTMLQGEPKGGKSCFALLAAIAVACGRWPFGRWQVAEPQNVLFITWEDGRRLIRDRIRQYTLGMVEPFQQLPNVSRLSIYARENAPRIRLDKPEGEALLRGLIEKHSARFVVIDTLSHLSNGDENSKQEMQPVMDALSDTSRDTKASIMPIHHTGKPNEKSGKSTVYRSRGSTSIPAAFHAILDWGTNAANLTQVKFFDKEGHKDEFVVEYIPDGDDIVRWKLSNKEDDADKYSARRAILESLQVIVERSPEGATRADVSKETKLSKNTVIQHLDNLVKEGSIQSRQVDRLGGGRPVWLYAPITYKFPITNPPNGI